MAVDIALFSCYSQRAQCDITYLPPGSRLLTISGMDSELKKCELCSYLPESYDVLPAGFMSKHLPSAYYSEVATGQTSFDITHLAQIFMFMPHSEKNFPVIGAYDENNQQAFKQYNLKCEAAKVEKFECTISAKQFNDCFLNAPGVEVNNTRVYNMQVDVAHLNNEIYKQLNGSCTETAGPGGGGGCGYSFKATSNLDALELPAQTILGADNLLV